MSKEVKISVVRTTAHWDRPESFGESVPDRIGGYTRPGVALHMLSALVQGFAASGPLPDTEVIVNRAFILADAFLERVGRDDEAATVALVEEEETAPDA